MPALNPITLQLKHAPTPLREAVAWFIAGSDVALWLEEIGRWGIAQTGLRLFVLPRSARDRAAAGVLVLPAAGTSPRCTPRALAFGVLAGKLHVPVDAELWPPAEPEELQLLHELFVFHPGIGLVGFEHSEAISLATLLRQPPSRVENWNCARASFQLNERLYSVQLLTPPSPEQIFGDAPNEIGNEPDQELPPAPDEPSNSAGSRLQREVNRRLAQLIRSLFERVPHNAASRTWVNKLEDWAAKKMQRLALDMENIRNKQIHRLLHQLKSDPDEGLRHAPGVSHNFRGHGPPSATLGTRDVNFNLDSLRGGRPIDAWHVSIDLERQLRSLYLELANRELRLGRFRRAAYIFAHLLGDLESAASALKQGRHFQEAAVVFREHLHRPLEAAACLAEGGLFVEAIAIYEEQSRFLEAGDLHARLGQQEQAAAAYEREAEKRLHNFDRLGAAEILDKKLNAPERAFTVLCESWPHSPQAGKCLEAGFELMAHKSWHARAVALLEKLRGENTRPDLTLTLTQILTTQAGRYPDRVVRHLASDLVRIKVSQRFSAAPSDTELSWYGELLTRLAPEDKLLARDVSRFRGLSTERPRSVKRQVVTWKRRGPILVRSFELPRFVSWQNVKSCGSFFFAAGHGLDPESGAHHLYLVRGEWEGGIQVVSWPVFMPQGVLLELDEETTRPPQVLVVPGPSRPLVRLEEKAFLATDRFSGVVRAGTPGWVPEGLAAACCRGEFVWLLLEPGSPVAACYGPGGILIRSFELKDHSHFGDAYGGSLLVQRDLVWISYTHRLLLLRQDQTVATWDSEPAIISLVASAPNLPLAAVACLDKGVSIHWPDAPERSGEILCPDLRTPSAAFTADGTLVLVSAREGRICEINKEGATEVSEFRLLWDAVAVTRVEGRNQFAVFSADGKVQVFRVS